MDIPSIHTSIPLCIANETYEVNVAVAIVGDDRHILRVGKIYKIGRPISSEERDAVSHWIAANMDEVQAQLDEWADGVESRDFAESCGY